ncbi:hypothetical protein [Maricaulis alexandrii]|uniref:hypothetical protein n=1 Tax=Maricaulis alexandrii TaxID=2570354 RepID=UPI001108A21C|nr:hypothetical protein [Maricaulis alexandrii]
MRPRNHQPHRRQPGSRPHWSGIKVDTPDTLSRFGVRPEVMARFLDSVTPETVARGTLSTAQLALMDKKPREAERYQIMTLRFIKIAEGLESLREAREDRDAKQTLLGDYLEELHKAIDEHEAAEAAKRGQRATGCPPDEDPGKWR